MNSAIPARTGNRSHLWIRVATVLLAVLILVTLALMWWWDHEPDTFAVVPHAQERAAARGQPVVTGTVTAETLIRVTGTLLDKRGGYLSNDVMPPGLFMDNVPNWEFGVLVQTRDFAKALRNEFSRSQTQSTEDPDLMEADPLYSSPNDRWLLPSSEGQYRKAVGHIDGYLARLTDADPYNAQFYARADNLAD